MVGRFISLRAIFGHLKVKDCQPGRRISVRPAIIIPDFPEKGKGNLFALPIDDVIMGRLAGLLDLIGLGRPPCGTGPAGYERALRRLAAGHHLGQPPRPGQKTAR